MAAAVSTGVAVVVSAVDVVGLIAVVVAVDSVAAEAWTEEEAVLVVDHVADEVALTVAARWTTVETGEWTDVVDDLIKLSRPKKKGGGDVCIYFKRTWIHSGIKIVAEYRMATGIVFIVTLVN